MSTEFRLPELGENVAKGDLVKVLVSVGDQIAKDQAVIELETEKATLEVPSSVGGKVESILVKPGEQVKVGQVILTVNDGGSDGAQAPPTEPKSAAPESGEQPKPKVNGAEAVTQATAERTPPAQPEGQPGHTTGKPGATTEFRLPELGENVEKGDLLKVLVSTGDLIGLEQPVLELETEKATLEVPSSVSGRVKEIHVKSGDKVKVGQLIFTLESAAPPDAAGAKDEPEAPASTSAPNTQAAAPQHTAPKPVSQRSAPAPAADSLSIEPRPTTAGAPAVSSEKRLVPAAPSVRRMARELGVEIAEVPGSGPGGRISAGDVKTYIRNLNTRQREARYQFGGSVPMPDFSRWGAVERESMRAVRRATASHLAHAWVTVPRVTQHDRADVTHIDKLRKQHSPKAEAQGGKLTITAITLKVVASALNKFPQFAASIDPEREEIIYKKYRHVGVAVDTDRGLLVPVIRDVDKKNIVELSVEISRVAEKARNRKLAPEDMEGGVFSISNLGGIGGTSFTPIVNWPEVAILGMSRSSFEPVYIDGTFQPRLMLPLSLSYDHRLIDGADAARFLRWVAEALEQPFLIPFEG
jgi:pyruvate dehydrogenase E2 component (dihydrolipoamide acetyltransferase)